jgi:DHA2 family multidrug resistance protein
MAKGIPEQHGQINPWLIAIAVMSATFMEVLDTTVVNVSLPHISGSMSSTTDEATWTLTSYLVANAIILPMTGWLANQFGRKRLLMGSVMGFTIASFFCGFAPNLPFLIVFRVIQGATGGGLQPLSQAILMESFPPKDRGKAMGFWGLGIVVAPMLGPVLGGWLTDNYSWRWVFYINIPIGLIALFMIRLFIFDPDYIGKKSQKVDYWGIGLLVLGIAALQIMLDKGQQEDWFASHFITVLAVLAVVGLGGLVIRELMAEHPIVDLRIFKRRTYATGVFLMTILGFVLYGSTVLLPLLMQTLLGYTAFQAGITTMPRGAASFIAMPLVGFMLSKFEPRKMLFVGMAGTGLALFLFGHLSTNAGYTDFMWPMILQGFSMGLVFIPLTTITNGPIPKEQMGNATSIFNLMRNIGASIGIASVTTVLARKQQVHTAELGTNITQYSIGVQTMLQGLQQTMMAGGADAATAAQRSNAAIFGIVMQQAAMMAYNDAFILMAGLAFLMLPLIFLMKKPPKSEGPVIAH